MKKCRQCGMLSADTATVCRSCHAKFTEDDKSIVAPSKKNKKSVISIVMCAILFLLILGVILYQSGIVTSWMESSKKEEISIIAEEFVNADFEGNAQKASEYMFDSYIKYQKKEGVIFLPDGKYHSAFFSAYASDVSIEVSSINFDFIKDEFDYYNGEIQNKYGVSATEIVALTVEVQITDKDIVSMTTVPLTAIKLDGNESWFIMPLF
ncbi:MAG: hypothetical protein IKU25_08520 [Clostridia bacterium]|nr:hypothetical protein [Clostridia bacterium]